MKASGTFHRKPVFLPRSTGICFPVACPFTQFIDQVSLAFSCLAAWYMSTNTCEKTRNTLFFPWKRIYNCWGFPLNVRWRISGWGQHFTNNRHVGRLPHSLRGHFLGPPSVGNMSWSDEHIVSIRCDMTVHDPAWLRFLYYSISALGRAIDGISCANEHWGPDRVKIMGEWKEWVELK